MAIIEKIFFKTAEIPCDPNEGEESIRVSQFTPAGTLLAALEDDTNAAPAPATGNANDIKLVPGKNVVFSADSISLLASQPGYPSINRDTDDTTTVITVDLEPLFTITAGNWSVKMTLYPSIDETPLPETSEIEAMLKSSGVSFGIRKKNIEEAVIAVLRENKPVRDQTVARGRLPVNGENGRLRLAIATESQPGKELKDGKMDFRERNLFIGVDKEQLLATLLPATTGLPGVNIFGQEIPQVPGKELIFKPGPDVLYDDSTGEIRAAFAGVLSVVNDTDVKITAKHVINGDIDYNTGNIDSRDAVHISGSVKPGFTVRGGGDVFIGGNVEAAAIIGQANVVLRGGLLQKGASITAEADIDMAFSQNGSTNSGGSCTVRREIYFSDISSIGTITCKGTAKVVASDLCSGGSVHVSDVDTESSPNSLLAAATDPKRYRRYLALLRSYHILQAEINKLQHRLGPGVHNEDIEELKEESEDVLKELSAFNLVPKTPENDRNSALRYACKQKISVSGTIRQGAVVRIGNSGATLEKEYRNGYFALNSDTEKIEFHSNFPGANASEKV
ncbi:MAG: FapA family protein [Desulfopila sp.]|nr:FapA family protein [Desulfopila sp.]